jgi:hypothetical protein
VYRIQVSAPQTETLGTLRTFLAPYVPQVRAAESLGMEAPAASRLDAPTVLAASVPAGELEKFDASLRKLPGITVLPVPPAGPPAAGATSLGFAPSASAPSRPSTPALEEAKPPAPTSPEPTPEDRALAAKSEARAREGVEATVQVHLYVFPAPVSGPK